MNSTPATNRNELPRFEAAPARELDAVERAPRSHGKFYSLLGICALLLLCLGLLGAWCLRELGAEYTRVINHAARRFSLLQNLGENLAQLDKRLSQPPPLSSPAMAHGFCEEILQLQTQNKARLAELEPFVDDAFFKPGLEELRTQEKILIEACSRLATLLASDDLRAASAFRLEQLSPQVENTRTATRKLNRMITDHMLRVSNETTGKADRLTKLVAGLGALPIAIGAALCLLVIAILSLLAWQVRHDQTL